MDSIWSQDEMQQPIQSRVSENIEPTTTTEAPNDVHKNQMTSTARSRPRQSKRRFDQFAQEESEDELSNSKDERLARQEGTIRRLRKQVEGREESARQSLLTLKETEARHRNEIADMNKQFRESERDHKKALRRINDEFNCEEKEKEWAYDEIQNQIEEIAALEKELAAEKKRNKEMEELIIHIQDENRELQADTGVLAEELETSDRDLKALKKKEILWEQQLKQQEHTIRQAQEAAEAMCEQAGWTPEADSVMKDELKTLADLIQDFSKRNTVQVAEEKSWKTKFEEIKHEMKGHLSDASLAAMEGPRLSKKVPWLLVSASLSQFICTQILAKPFYFLKVCSNGDGGVRTVDAIVHQVFEDLAGAYGKEPKELNLVRSDLLRLYHPRDSGQSTNQIGGLKAALSDAKNTSHDGFLKSFINQVSILLSDPSSKETLDELAEIISKAQDVSTKTGTQRSGLHCDGFESLPGTFDHRSDVMEAHSLHNKELADDEAALDGKAIVLVLQPAIIAVGKSDGSDYKVRRILMKAIVLMG